MKLYTFLSIISLTVSSVALPPSFEPEKEALDALFTNTMPGSPAQTVYQFCKDLINKSDDASASAVRETIGEVIYLYGIDPMGTASLINSSDVVGSKTRVMLRFTKAMGDISQDLFKVKIAHQTTTLQNPNLAVEERLPRIIAKALVTSSGKVNFALAGPIKKYLLPTTTLDYQNDIARALDLLTAIDSDDTKSAEWINIFGNVTKPLDPKSSANDLIRVCLNLPAGTAITDNHAKQVFLYIFMGHARQGPVGDCFEEWWKITVKDGLWHTLATDATQLIKYGALVRNVNGSQQTFPFDYAIADDNLKNKAVIDQNGKMRTGAWLFDAPGIVIAANQMGITDLSSAASSALSLLLGGNTSATVTAEQVIDALAKVSFMMGQGGGRDLASLENIGYVGFSSENTCAPLEMYGSSLASFAEKLRNDYVRGSVINAVDRALDSQWLKATLPWQISTINNLKAAFFSTLNNQFEFYYNERIELATPAADGSSTAGAFEMHKSTGELIRGPADFQKLIVATLSQLKANAEQLAKSNLINQIMMKWTQDCCDKIIAYITGSSNFMKMVLWNYSPESKQVTDPVTNWMQLAHTPWLDQTGDDPSAVFEIATGMMLPKASTVVPANAHQLASSFLQFARNFEKSQHYLENPLFTGRIPVWNTIHAYTGRMDDPAVVDAVRSSLSVEDWLSKQLFQTGRMVSMSPIPKDVASAVVQQVSNALPQADARTFLSKANGIYKDGINVRDFSRSVVKGVAAISSRYSGTQMFTRVSQLVTSVLLETLPMDRMSTLIGAAVQAFDTNWADEDNDQGLPTDARDIHFCFFFDPVSEDILLGIVDEDETELRLIDQDQWVIGEQWEFVPAVITDSAK